MVVHGPYIPGIITRYQAYSHIPGMECVASSTSYDKLSAVILLYRCACMYHKRFGFFFGTQVSMTLRLESKAGTRLFFNLSPR